MLFRRTKRPSERHTPRWATWVAPVVTLAALVGIWEAYAKLSDVKQFLLPAPSELYAHLVDNWQLYWEEAQFTIQASVAGFLITIGFSVVLSVLIVWSPVFEATVYPLVIMTQVIPKVAIAPLLIVYMGFGLQPKIFLAFLVSFFPMVINTTLGLKSVDRELIELLGSLKATKLQVLRKVRLQTALPYMVEGAKVAIAFSIIGAIVGEFSSGSSGLGYLVNASTVSLNTVQGYSALVVLTVVGVILFGLVNVIGQLLIPWRKRVVA